MAIAAQRKGERRKIVAVIGDGAMTAGMAFEALNHGGDVEPDMLVDPQRQPDVDQRERRRADPDARAPDGQPHAQSHARRRQEADAARVVCLWRFIKRWEEHAKGMFVPSTLFEELGFHYTGPIDGHDLPQLVHALRTLKELKGPQLLHVITTKGKGYAPAELEQIDYHAVGPFDPDKGLAQEGDRRKPSYTGYLRRLAVRPWPRPSRSCTAITPAMREGSGLVRFSKEYPHAISTSASPSNMRSRWPRAWPAKAPSRWSRSTRRFCSAPTTS